MRAKSRAVALKPPEYQRALAIDDHIGPVFVARAFQSSSRPHERSSVTSASAEGRAGPA
jgi:hypothetical protein